ncbi:sulfite exporter TauE/SafE family protein [Chitinophaga sp. 30R24]|uniref:urease accessory protein UreH domain-containing protein n=1 Tax=Chitinophaga sp. 30R24 TaxID=3248838 RepID=UPI003B987FE0
MHAFETDHLLAVSNIVSQRNKIKQALKDGIFWGLGHTSTLCVIGLMMIAFRMNIKAYYFHYFEATVGGMLITLGLYRLYKLVTKKILLHTHTHTHDGHGTHQHLHVHNSRDSTAHHHAHSLAYGVGLVHGLAGSGALVVMVMLKTKEPINGLLYLLIFGGGSVVGMLVAAGLFSIPFSKKIMHAKTLQSTLVVLSSVLCLLYGSKVIYENMIAQ